MLFPINLRVLEFENSWPFAHKGKSMLTHKIQFSLIYSLIVYYDVDLTHLLLI